MREKEKARKENITIIYYYTKIVKLCNNIQLSSGERSLSNGNVSLVVSFRCAFLVLLLLTVTCSFNVKTRKVIKLGIAWYRLNGTGRRRQSLPIT